jgi:hypothetical protein
MKNNAILYRRDFLKITGIAAVSLGLIKSLSIAQSNRSDQNQVSQFEEPYRPQFQLTPDHGWINDPCGIFFTKLQSQDFDGQVAGVTRRSPF